MKANRFWTSLTAAVMMLSMTVLPASAEETATEITIKGTQFSNTLADENGIAYNQYQDTRPMSVIFNVAEEGYYNFQFRASDGSRTYISPYYVELNGSSTFEKKESGELESNGIYSVFDYGAVYLNAGLNELTYTMTALRTDEHNIQSYRIHLDYAKFTKLSDYKIDLNYADRAFSGGSVNDKDRYRYINDTKCGTIEATVSANTEGWYKMSYEATAGDGSNSYLSEYSITLNDNDVTVPAPGTSTDNSMNKHEVAENVWLKEGNNTLVFNINKPRTADGTYYFTIRSVSFTLSDKANNKIYLPYSSFSGNDGEGMIDGYMLAYNNDATLRTMTATFNAETAGVYSLRLVSTTGAPGAGNQISTHSPFKVEVNGEQIYKFDKIARVLRPNGTAASELVENVAQNVTLKEGENTINITPTALLSSNNYLLYLKDALFTKTDATTEMTVNVESNTVNVTYTNANATGILIVTRYDNDGRMTEVKTADAARAVNSTDKSITLTPADGKIKVMLWDNCENVYPLIKDPVIYPTE